MAAGHLHILGICGSFMGGLAAIARETGFKVTGCDKNVYPPMSDQLRNLGIDLVDGYGADQLSLRPDVWVVGNVVSRGNPLMEAILDSGQRYLSGPQWLSENILYGKWVLAVAGTHGKTSVSAMLAWILDRAGMAPGFLIGGIPNNFGISARHLPSDMFVIEADEYDTAFFDKRSKFVHYRPKTTILNNLEFDHADIFAELADIERQFHQLVRIVPRSGRLIVNGIDAAITRVLEKGSWAPVERFGVADGWDATQDTGDGSFMVCRKGEALGRVRWSLSGDHNRMNALAAIAAGCHAGVEPATAIEALAGFEGVRRRMELRGFVRGITVYDDFAHHPTAIATTIAGLRRRVGAARILAVLEPRSNTMKLGVMKDRLPGSCAAADRIYVYGANLDWDAAQLFAPLAERTWCGADLGALVERVAGDARPGDHVLVMSNGGFGGVHEKLIARLQADA
jgi:UDP-N-acetylmuramate: L-alanyl-gamma-D-glutamyl-meso-diaminopimelate ligase